MKKYIFFVCIFIWMTTNTMFAQEASVKCPTCARGNETNYQYCFNCGTQLCLSATRADSTFSSKRVDDLTTAELQLLIERKVVEELKKYDIHRRRINHDREETRSFVIAVLAMVVMGSLVLADR